MYVEKNHIETDESLLQRLAMDDQVAFSTIYLRYHDGLYNYLLKFTKNPTKAQDFVQDIFLKIWETRTTINIQSSFSAYLYRYAHNHAFNHLRRLAVDTKYLQETLHRIELGINDQSIINNLQWQQYQSLLGQALATLTPAKKQAFELVRTNGMSYEEAATLMGISRNTLKEHLVLAVKAIKQYLLTHGDVALMLILIPLLNISKFNFQLLSSVT
ncbi:MAG: sigma-70 family RNA polymerase sigma factor [Bacteroidetes bacterium]|nr:sigma-70 family RNA polymerase sigma factor [Bacteroidota bacterium]